MRNKIILLSWIIMGVLMLYFPLFAHQGDKPNGRWGTSSSTEPTRVPTEEELIQYVDRILSRGDNGITVEGLNMFMTEFTQYYTALGYNKLVQKIMDIQDFESYYKQYPEQPYSFSVSRLRMLAHVKNYPGVREFVIKSSESQIPKIQSAAAATLLSWGEWDLAAPILNKYEAYGDFQHYKDNRAIPLLEDAVKNASWQGRIFAAAALYYTYGDSTKYPQVALDILLHAPVNAPDEETKRAIFLALDQVPRFNLTAALPGLIRLAQDTTRSIGPTVVGYLVDLAGMGHPEAKQALIEIEANNPNADIREIAKNGLAKLEQQK